MNPLAVHPTGIPGLMIVDLPLHDDPRGWFKENWQREKMTALGLPDFGPVQHNIAFNTDAGVIRGVHAEPWDKFVSLVSGRIFGAWVDLREGPHFGRVVTREMGPDTAVFVPRGVGNAYQTLEPATTYTYLVNAHWSPQARDSYSFVNLADPALAIPWPLPVNPASMSAADQDHPELAAVEPVKPRSTVILGAGGQLGRALTALLPCALAFTRADLDLTEPDHLDRINWADVEVVINAAAYTAVDAAETPAGRRQAWSTNVTALARLVEMCRTHRICLVHVSSDYVFDGSAPEHDETEPLSPLGVYGQTKAAGDALVSTLARHYLIRTSWVVGAGRNFVATMADLADRDVSPEVVNDQFGRLTFTEDLAAAVAHLLRTGAAPGTYNVTNTGPVQSWADIAATVFELRGKDPSLVRPVSGHSYATAQLNAGRPFAPRPTNSALNLAKIGATGLEPPPAQDRLREYLS